MDEHSPGPWRAGRDEAGPIVLDRNGRIIGSFEDYADAAKASNAPEYAQVMRRLQGEVRALRSERDHARQEHSRRLGEQARHARTRSILRELVEAGEGMLAATGRVQPNTPADVMPLHESERAMRSALARAKEEVGRGE